MNVLLISQCSGRALPGTRRILDQFAERRGERTWQTAITQEGLDTLRRLLKKTARRNTAVACHWIRARDHSELIWIVGSARRFNAEGSVPTNTTSRDILRHADENDWHTGEIIRLLAKLASLFHDLGKASKAFQAKLIASGSIRDAYRHEWVSLKMFEAFVAGRSDADWLQDLSTLSPDRNPVWMERIDANDVVFLRASPFKNLPLLARSIGWLIVSHHFLPFDDSNAAKDLARLSQLPRQISARWDRIDDQATEKSQRACWIFPDGFTPFASQSWCNEVRQVAHRMQKHPGLLEHDWLENRYVAHLSRLCLMLADHHYSSLSSDTLRGDKQFPLYANTRDGEVNQRLDEHLLGVGSGAGSVARHLPSIERDLPRIARHRGFSRRSANRDYAWQDRAYDLATGLRERAAQQGFFGVNMASTGCGKTLANIRILYALADPQRGMRASVALGLRTLTLQTGQVYRERLHLGEDDLAVRVGGSARALYEDTQQYKSPNHEPTYLQQGSESSSPLIDDDSYVHFEGSLSAGPLQRWLQKDLGVAKLLNAPILVSTIDHLIPATEGTRGGRQIAPMLRLMSSDLVLDEPDDFDLKDLPALTRLVHWAGMLGSRVVLSSATLPPAMVRGLFEAYQHGRGIHRRNRGNAAINDPVCCAWFDEFGGDSVDCIDSASFKDAHRNFAIRRARQLEDAEIRRHGCIHPLRIAINQHRETIRRQWAEQLHALLHKQHAAHCSPDPSSGKRVSCGLIRMAHIDPLIDTARHLFGAGATTDHRIHLCCYHSRHPLLVRAAIERTLDACLDRRAPDALFRLPEIRDCLDRHAESDQIFVVLASPVAEVGRDHDYDWAIVEPSSERSIIQLAGRVRRHRAGECEVPNIVLMGSNLAALENPGHPAYCRPGFESSDWKLTSHRLADLLTPEQYESIKAIPRIVEREPLQPHANLVDLEHQRLRHEFASPDPDNQQDYGKWNAALWLHSPLHLTGMAQKYQRFRAGVAQTRYVLMPDEELQDTTFVRVERDNTFTACKELCEPTQLPLGPRIKPWAVAEYLPELQRLMDAFDMPAERCARQFGFLDMEARDQGWLYHPALGLRRNLT